MASVQVEVSHDGPGDDAGMMILRRGRAVQPTGSGLDIEMMFELGGGNGRRPDNRESWRPPVEVFECAGELVVRVEIAGLSLADVEVLVDEDELRIRGERTAGYPSGQRVYYESRLRYGPFEAAVRLPFPVAVGDASADYVEGLLSIRLPRRVAVRVPMRDDSTSPDPDRGER